MSKYITVYYVGLENGYHDLNNRFQSEEEAEKWLLITKIVEPQLNFIIRAQSVCQNALEEYKNMNLRYVYLSDEEIESYLIMNKLTE